LCMWGVLRGSLTVRRFIARGFNFFDCTDFGARSYHDKSALSGFELGGNEPN
jgi:hypothetical protein